MTKITELTSLAALASGDEFAVVDADAAETKRVTIANALRSTPSGSAASPSLAFAGDTDSGLYSPAGNAVGVVTGGSERVRVDSSGQVGIGTSSPDGILHAHVASAGTVTAAADYNDLVVENSSNVGMSLLSPNANTGGIAFGDPDDNDIGSISYSHSTNTMTVTAGAEALLTIATAGVTADGVLLKDGHINWDKAGDVASATTTDIWATTGMVIDITGTTTIADFADAPSAGATRYLQFDGVLTLTHGSGITCPGGANITTAAGDTCMVYADTTTAFVVAWYQRADGTALSGGGLSNIVEDTTPQLGGDLDLNGNNIDFPTTPNISDCLDEDDMSSNSATALATQQSIRAYAMASAPDFTSTEQTVTADTVLDVVHSLGAIPRLVEVVLRCKTTEHGYAVNDEILIGSLNASGDSAVTCNVDATNVTIVQGATIDLISQSTTNGVSITVGNFKWVVRAWT